MKKILLFLLAFTNLMYPCTGINISSAGGAFISARSIEYAESNLNSKLVIVGKNQNFVSLLPNTKETGLKYKSKYAYVGISVMDDRFIAEGINEAGLNAGLFYFPHYGSLKRYDKKYKNKSIIDMQLVSYLLANYKNVEEVKKAIKNIIVLNIAYDENNNPLPTAHYRVSDSKQNSIVIEIVNNGEVKIYDNKVGILTNSPDFEWQVKNLNNYINLKAGNALNDLEDEKLFSFGAGTAALGLPGDITPPSRFVRAFFYKSTMPKPKDNISAINNAFVILNNFDIPVWIEYPKNAQEHIPNNLKSATQWTSVSDLTNKVFYYKTMNNSQIRKVDLNKIDFNNITYKILELDEKESIKELKIN